MRKAGSATGEIHDSLKHTIHKPLSKSQSVLESTDHPLHNELSQMLLCEQAYSL